ncbi:MAG: alpha/beta hydrolase [Chloroflexota bacterium]
MRAWQPYAQVYPGGSHTVSGTVRVLRGVSSHGLAPRDLLVYLPPSYAVDATRRFPVMYLHDGQNVFDEATSHAGEWGADEAAEALASRGLEAILVAVPNAGQARADEYSPWATWLSGSDRANLAAAYVDFLLQTVKPCVDASFQTESGRAGTAIAGSSLGGLISLYACLSRPGIFGYCAALSPALWPGRGSIFRFARERHDPGLRVYLDAGGQEGGARYVAQVRRMRTLLRAQGYDVSYVEDPAAGHNEEAWRRRFPAVLRAFLQPCSDVT